MRILRVITRIVAKFVLVPEECLIYDQLMRNSVVISRRNQLLSSFKKRTEDAEFLILWRYIKHSGNVEYAIWLDKIQISIGYHRSFAKEFKKWSLPNYMFKNFHMIRWLAANERIDTNPQYGRHHVIDGNINVQNARWLVINYKRRGIKLELRYWLWEGGRHGATWRIR